MKHKTANLLFLALGLFMVGCTQMTVEEVGSDPVAAFDPVVITAGDPSDTQKVTLAMGAASESVAAGNVVTVGVNMKVLPGWHIYAVDQPTGVAKPTVLALNLPDGFEAVGSWDIPEAHAFDDQAYGYEGDVTFRHRVKAVSAAAGAHQISCEVRYQACNDKSCTAPTKTPVQTTITVQ